MHNTYRLAGHTVKIESVFPQVHTLCADYRTDDPPEYVITTTETDIAFERAKSVQENIQEGVPVQEYEDSYLERYNLADWAKDRYKGLAVKASACIKCGKCETRCPYHLPIRKMLEKAVEEFGE